MKTFDAALLSRIEDAGLNASAPPQQRLIDGWLVRFSPGTAKRARAVNAIAAGRLPLAQKLALCERVYDDAKLPLIFRLTPFTEPRQLGASLAAMGLRQFSDTRVMVLPDLQVLPSTPRAAGTTFHWVGHEVFAQTVGALRGSPLPQRQAHAERLRNAPVPFSAQLLKRNGEVLACGQFALEADLVGLYDVFTAPAARGQGMARALCRELLAQAAIRGARHAYLQVESDNHAAHAVYQRLGFSEGYAYHYLARDPSHA